MSDQLMEMDLWWIVSGREVAPKSDSTELADVLAYDKWLRKCSHITAKIRNAMEPHICAQYASDVYDENPKVLWDKLSEDHGEALGLKLYYFRLSLFDCTLEAHKTVAGYVHEIDRIIECLREAGGVVAPQEKTFYLLNGLPPSWRKWRDQMATIIKPDQPDELVVAIKAREASLNRDKEESSNTGLAVHSRRLAGQRGYKGGRRTEQKRSEGQNRSSRNETVTCYYCQKKGHKRSECRKLKSDREKGIEGNRSGSLVPAVASGIDMMSCSIFSPFTSTSALLGRGQWLLSSVSSTHVTGLKEHFLSYTPIPPGHRKIQVTNNMEIDALGEGEVTLTVWDQLGQRESSLVITGVLHVPECGRNNLLSVSRLCSSGYCVEFYKSGGTLLKKDDGLAVKLEEVNRLYVLQASLSTFTDRI